MPAEPPLVSAKTLVLFIPLLVSENVTDGIERDASRPGRECSYIKAISQVLIRVHANPRVEMKRKFR